MEIRFARSEFEIAQCFPVMVQLRPHLDPAEFVSRVQRQQQVGYQLVYLDVDEAVRAVVGFRMLETLAHGKILYVDDLVTDVVVHGKGYATTLMTWLMGYGKSHHCRSLQLDSGIQRSPAHRFYFGRGFSIMAFRFAQSLDERLGD